MSIALAVDIASRMFSSCSRAPLFAIYLTIFHKRKQRQKSHSFAKSRIIVSAVMILVIALGMVRYFRRHLLTNIK